MSEHQLSEEKIQSQVQVEEEEEYFSMEEDDTPINSPTSESENEDGIKANETPRHASKAPRKTFASKAPKRSLKAPSSIVTKKTMDRITARRQSHDYVQLSTIQGNHATNSSAFFKKTPLARAVRYFLRLDAEEMGNGEEAMMNTSGEEGFYPNTFRITGPALERIRFFIERFSLDTFKYLRCIAAHTKRKTIMPRDIALYRVIKDL